jgi:amino acid permease
LAFGCHSGASPITSSMGGATQHRGGFKRERERRNMLIAELLIALLWAFFYYFLFKTLAELNLENIQINAVRVGARHLAILLLLFHPAIRLKLFLYEHSYSVHILHPSGRGPQFDLL